MTENDELQSMQEEAVVAWICLESLKKTMNASTRITCLRAEIRTRGLPNKKQKF
jgi:hypothetical protein